MENSSRAFLDVVGKSMRQIRQAVGSDIVDPKLLTYAERLQYEGYPRRQETNEAIKELSEKGASIRQIVRIPQYQRMVHYALAGYGTLAAFANRLGLDGDAAVLKKCLDQTYDGDRRMTAIAMKGGVNKDAAS